MKKYVYQLHYKVWPERVRQAVGPLLLTALSFFLSIAVCHCIGKIFSPDWNILASRGIPKIILTAVALCHVSALSYFHMSPAFFMRRNLFFLFSRQWIKPFFYFWFLFFFLHCAALFFCIISGDASLSLHTLTLSSLLKGTFLFLWGCLVTFMLALTEEIIFRGTIFPYISRYLSLLPALFFTSLIFSLCHGLPRFDLFVVDNFMIAWGLFLFGYLLNTIYVCMGRLYYNVAAHAGMVCVKVFMRKIPIITFAPAHHWWFHPDGRQAVLMHFLFMSAILFFLSLRFSRPFPSFFLRR